MQKKIYYLTPSSFCWGVERSIEQLDDILRDHPDDEVYCIHAIVHNPGVTQEFVDKGVIFVETLDEIDNSQAIVAFSAHGTDRHILEDAARRFQKIYNLECPLVTKIYREVDMYAKRGITRFVYIGKKGHQEAKNVERYMQLKGYDVTMCLTKEELPEIADDVQFGVLSQTTLNYAYVKDFVKHIAKQYPGATFPPLTDICKATYDRQTVLIQYEDLYDTLIVIGGKASHNTKELVLLGEKLGKKVYYDEFGERVISLGEKELTVSGRIAVTGGASTPTEQMQMVYDRYVSVGYEGETLTLEENDGDYV